MSLKEKIKDLFSNKEKVIKYSYLISSIIGLITLGLFTLDLDTGSDYKNFYMLVFSSISNKMFYILVFLIVAYYFLATLYSFVSYTFFEKKDPKVRNNTLKYAKLNEVLSIILTLIFAVFVLVFLCLTNVLIGKNINLGLSILLGILSFLTIFIDGVGDYFDEVQSNIRAREIIEERKKEAEEAKLQREKKLQNKETTTSKKD